MDNLNSMIDHTQLKPDASDEMIKQLCDEAKEYQFATVFVNPVWVRFAAEQLEGTKVKVGSVIAFPLGAETTGMRVMAAKELIILGAQELDMVMDIGALKSGNESLVLQDIQQVVKAAGTTAIVKVIIEACLLTEKEKIRACELCLEGGVHFVKTSTGFSKSGATIEDVRLMRKVVGSRAGVKASGGIRDRETALAMVEAGANRLGTSAGPALMNLQRVCGKNTCSEKY